MAFCTSPRCSYYHLNGFCCGDVQTWFSLPSMSFCTSPQCSYDPYDHLNSFCCGDVQTWFLLPSMAFCTSPDARHVRDSRKASLALPRREARRVEAAFTRARGEASEGRPSPGEARRVIGTARRVSLQTRSPRLASPRAHL